MSRLGAKLNIMKVIEVWGGSKQQRTVLGTFVHNCTIGISCFHHLDRAKCFVSQFRSLFIITFVSLKVRNWTQVNKNTQEFS